MKPFDSIVVSALKETPVVDKLRGASAVVLERIARGGGATRWYYCHDATRLEEIAARFQPGSVVSFYFDDRIKSAQYSKKIRDEAAGIVGRAGEVIVGVLAEDGIEIGAEVVTGPKELEEVTSTLTEGALVFVGAFPARDNDGRAAVTITLPDADGVVRPHPH